MARSRSHLGPIARWSGELPRVLLSMAALAAMVAVGCGNENASAIGDGYKASGDAGDGGVTTCEDGQVKDCFVYVGENSGILSCYEGIQVCQDGSFGACRDGTVVQRRAPSKPVGGGMKVMSLSDAGSCEDNPCDPSCQVFDEEPPDGGVSLEASVEGPEWVTSSLEDLEDNNWPGGLFKAGLTEPCFSNRDCQYDQYCYEPHTAAACAHSKCASGAALDSTCDTCVTAVCEDTPSCCTDAWTTDCIDKVGSVCGSFCAVTGTCTHDICVSGDPLTAGCDSCVDDICAIDPYCCDTAWDNYCITKVGSVCNVNCGPPAGDCRQFQPDETNPYCTDKPDLTAGVPCGNTIPICNRGAVTVEANTASFFFFPGLSANNTDTGFTSCEVSTPLQNTAEECPIYEDIPPGECRSLSCPNLDNNGGVLVNPWDMNGYTPIDECICQNNWSLFKKDDDAVCGAPACLATTVEATIPTVNMYVMYDKSGSMNANVSTLRVDTPSSIAGNMEALEADFTSELVNTGSKSGSLVATQPANACSALTNASSISGKVALIDRGSCNFYDKIVRAKSAGAIGVVVVNNVAGPPLVMGSTDGDVTGVPALMISQADGSTLKSTSGATVTLMHVGTRWSLSAEALKGFVRDPGSSGLRVALRFFPGTYDSQECGGYTCSIAGCATPQVGLGALLEAQGTDPPTKKCDSEPDPQECALVNAINGTSPNGWTPTLVALGGAADHMGDHAWNYPMERSVVVLVTDGYPAGDSDYPYECRSPADSYIVEQAESAYSTYGVTTYTINVVGGDETLMKAIATAGHGEYFYVSDSNASTELVEALKQIRSNSVSCDLLLDSGTGINPDEVSLLFTDSSTTTHDFTRVASETDCGTLNDRWYFDDPNQPTKITLCPSTCARVRSDLQSKLELEIGCPSQFDPATIVETYSGSCPPGSSVRWGQLTWSTDTPGNSNVTFEARTSNDVNDFATAPVAGELKTLGVAHDAVAPYVSDTQTCTMFGPAPECPAELVDKLSFPDADYQHLELHMTLNPASTGSSLPPSLYSWNVTYSCVDSE